MNPGGDILMAGGLISRQGDCLAHGVQEGGAACSQVGGACHYHFHTLNLHTHTHTHREREREREKKK